MTLAIEAPAEGRRKAWIFALAMMAAILAVNLAAHLWRVQGHEPPEYGKWSGVLEVERKIRLLREFAREGPVDALILSSSMGDLGISAQVLTQEMSALLGRPFRVFNFSMGGADLGTYPILYRLARIAARPREVWVVSPVSLVHDKIHAGSLDDKLILGSVGHYAEVPYLLPVSYELFQIPIVRRAPAIRDAGMYLRFENRPVTNLDLYDINRFGDTVSWLYNVQQYGHGDKLMADRRSEVLKFSAPISTDERSRHLGLYLTRRAITSLEDLRDRTREDGATIKLVAIDMAVALGMRDRDYLEASRGFFGPVSRLLEAPVVDIRPSFAVEPYMVSDSVHLNAFGANEFSRLLAARLSNRPAPPMTPPAAPAPVRERLQDPQWTPFTPLILKNPGDPAATLRLKFVQNWGVRYLGPYSNVDLLLRLANGTQARVPARVLAPGEVVADTSAVAFGAGSQILIAQLVYRGGSLTDRVDLPLASFRWSGEKPDIDFNEFVTLARVRSMEPVYASVARLRVAWDGIDGPSRSDFVAVYRAGVPGATRISSAQTRGESSGTVEMNPLFQSGTFELRLFRNNSAEVIAISEPFRVEAVSGRLAVANPVAHPGENLRVAWSALNHPHKDDWIGVFEDNGKNDVLSMGKTGGALEGSIEMPLPNPLKPGAYEVRLYSSGIWTLMDSSPIRIDPPTGAAGAR